MQITLAVAWKQHIFLLLFAGKKKEKKAIETLWPRSTFLWNMLAAIKYDGYILMKKAFCQQTDSLLALSRSNSHKCTKLRTIFLGKVFPKAFLFSTSNKPHPAFKSCWCLVQRLLFFTYLGLQLQFGLSQTVRFPYNPIHLLCM